MFDFRRLRGLLLVLTGLAVAVLACGEVLSVTVGRRPRWLPENDGKQDPMAYRKFGGRLAGAVRARPSPSERPLGVLLGASTLECAVDPEALTGEDRAGMRWLSLYGYRFDALELDRVARLLFRSDLKPDVVVVALNAGMLSRRSTVEPLGKEPTWPFPYRVRVNHLVWHAVLEARLALAERFGLRADRLFEPASDPWGVPDRLEYMEVQAGAEQRLRRQWEGLRRKGWFDPECFAPEGPNAEALVDLVSRARANGARVFVVLLPEMKALRAAMPSGASRLSETLLRRDFGPAAPAVIDLRDRMGDGAFFDLIHVAVDHRRAFTAELSRALGPILGTGRE